MDLIILKLIISVAAILIVSIWLYIGEITYHCYWDGGPLAGAGYNPILNNISKCYALFLVLILIAVFGIPSAEQIFNAPNVYVPLFTILFVLFPLKILFGWRS